MKIEDIELKIKQNIEGIVVAESADNVHFYVTIVASVFDGMTRINQHKLILDLFREDISSEAIHAFSIKTYTPEKWENLQS